MQIDFTCIWGPITRRHFLLDQGGNVTCAVLNVCVRFLQDVKYLRSMLIRQWTLNATSFEAHQITAEFCCSLILKRQNQHLQTILGSHYWKDTIPLGSMTQNSVYSKTLVCRESSEIPQNKINLLTHDTGTMLVSYCNIYQISTWACWISWLRHLWPRNGTNKKE